MENAGTGTQWFLIHEGQQTGPHSIAQLKTKASSSEIDPRLDKVWSEGMDDWIPAGELEGLFQRNEPTPPPPPTPSPSPQPNHPATQQPLQPTPTEALQPGGTNRRGYLFVTLIFPALWAVITSFMANFIGGEIDPNLLNNIVTASYLIPLLISIAATASRFRNLYMSRLWLLGLLIPILNLWLGYRLFACPHGYAVHHKLDGTGWLLTILYWASIFILFAASILLSLTFTDTLPGHELTKPLHDLINPHLEKLGKP